MKRLSSSDSLGGLMSICPNATDEEGNNLMYSREFQAAVDYDEESGHVSEKKRRLAVDQVKALEKTFEVENKLEPDRKVKLAQELGLQPRQVAVWFQNRRARWKTKQLERDYATLKASYDALNLNFEKLQHDNQSLLKEIRDLKSKLDGNDSVEEDKRKIDDGGAAAEIENAMNGGKLKEGNWPIRFGDLKDGSSDSDSSAIVNEEMNNNSNSSPRIHQLFDGSSIAEELGFQIGEMKESSSYEPQMVKIEEHNFFGEEHNFFADEQAPTLQQWYCIDDEWN